MSDDEGKKFDDGKLRYDLVDQRVHQEFVSVLTYGAHLYGPENWRKVAGGEHRYYSAAIRHLEAARSKTENQFDEDTHFHHLGHAMCCVHFLLGVQPVLPQQTMAEAAKQAKERAEFVAKLRAKK